MAEEKKTTLEEAAGLYLDNHKPLTRYNWGDLEEAFIAGAKWQYQKDRGEFAKIKAKTWCEGFDAHKQQMMKDAMLSWVDIDVIYTIMCGLNEKEFPRYSVAFYKEVLRLYNESNKIFNE